MNKKVKKHCISTILQCIHLCINIVYMQGVDKKIGHGIKLLTILLYRDSILTIQDIAFSKNINIIFGVLIHTVSYSE